jgi:hypothetical protein
VIGLLERIAYRAIVDQILDGGEPLARSRDDYLGFVRGPVDYVMHKAAGTRTFGLLLNDDETQYVVKSDLAAFYEYIDHGILGRLLVARSRNVELVQALMEFLSELEGRSYGVPQMFDASDRLSEVYAVSGCSSRCCAATSSRGTSERCSVPPRIWSGWPWAASPDTGSKERPTSSSIATSTGRYGLKPCGWRATPCCGSGTGSPCGLKTP